MSRVSLRPAARIIVAVLMIVLFLLLPVAAADLWGIGRLIDVPKLGANPFIVTTKWDTLVVDSDGDNTADPGDTIRYTAIVTNSGFMDATNVDFEDTIDANTTLVAGSVRTTPIARHDSYASIGNVGITVPAGGGVLANDNDPDGTTPTLTIVGISGCADTTAPFVCSAATANGGDVTLSADGSFTYDPALGFEGTDSFSYRVQDLDGNQDPATVFIVVSDVIWFIDNNAGGGGDGRLGTPFNSLADYNATAADDPGDVIFLYETGSGNYSGGIALQANQILVGQGVTPSLASVAGLTVPTHSNALPSTAGTRPEITNSGGSGITLGSNNLLRGLNVGNTGTSTGAGLSGVSVGNLEIAEMSLTGQGKAISLNGGGLLNVSLDTVAVTASTNGGVSLQNAGGTTSIGTLNLATTGGTGFLASNAGTVNVNSAGASTAIINSSGGPGINVSNSTLNATFTGVIVSNSSGIGVRLDTNGGSTNITGANNTVSTAGGTAVHVSNSTIGGSGMTFLSVSASNADTGISLNNTGTGDFTVTGSGTTDGSGGTLANLNDHGIELINAQDVSLSNMNLTNAATTQEVAPNTATCTNLSNGNNLGCNAPVYMRNATNVNLTNLTINGSVQHGVNGNNVNGLSISNTDVSNIGDQNKENGMHFINLLGTVSLSNVSVVGSDTRNVLIENDTGTANITVTNSTFNDAGTEVGLDFLGLGTANITFSISDSSFTHNNAPQLKALAEDNSVIDATITGNEFDGNPAVSGNSGIDLAAVDGGTITFDVIGTLANPQTFQPFRSHAINVFASGGGTASGKINGNTINGSAFGAGIHVVAQVTDFNGFDPSITIEIDGNYIDQIEGDGLAGIHIEARDGTSGLSGTAEIDATVTNNDVRTTDTVFLPTGGADAAIQVYLNDLNLASTPQNRVCLNATGNATEANGGTFGETDFFFGNDAISGSNSGVAQMQGFNTSVSNTWFTINGNTTTTSPTPLAQGLGPIGGGTCGTVAAVSQNQHLVSQPDSSSLARIAESVPLSQAREVEPPAKAVAAVNFSPLYDDLVKATRAMAADLVAALQPATVHASGETINLSLGDLNAGQVVVITFDVTVDGTIPANVNQVCNQGLVTGDNFAGVLTDDPAVGGSSDPTCRPIESNNAPIANDDSYNTNEDTVLVEATVGPLGDGVLANDTDADSDPLSAVLDTSPSNGTLTLNSDGSFTYTPNADYCGPDSFTYHANDGRADSNIATASIDVMCVNDPPIANDDTANTDEDTPIVIDVQGNDSAGPANEDQTLITVAISDPANGTATINPNGTVTYTPDLNFYGPDAFAYVVCDSGGLCDTATVTITVNPVNDPPIANDDTANTDEDTPIVIDLQDNDSAGPANEDQTLTTVAISDPANGMATINPNGTVTYTPDLNFYGPDAFAYVVCDSGGLCDTATATIVVNPVDDPPVANDDSATVTEDDPATAFNVLGNDTDIDGGPISIGSVTQPANGTVVNNGTDLTYQPDPDYCNDGSPTDDFTYTLTPGSSSATVRVTVVCVDDPPVVSVDVTTQSVQYSDRINAVTVTASDVDSHPLSISHNAPSALSTSGGCTPDGTGGTSCSWMLSGQILVAAGTYNITFTVSDATTGVTAGTQVVVTPEDADVGFDSDNPVAVPVSSPGGDSEPFSLTMHVTEFDNPDDVVGDSNLAGDITLADVTLTLVPVGPGSSVNPTLACNVTTSAGLSDPDSSFDYDMLDVECDFSGVPVNTYTVMVVVDGGYYSGSGEDVLVVYDPSLGFTTGGGWFYWPGTIDKTNFGYTMKYNKKGQKVKGSLLIIRHTSDGSIFRVKSNALDGLALGDEDSFGWATFSGKNTYLEPGWPEPKGNHSFIVYVEDHGEPGADADRFWIEVQDKDGNTVNLSMDREAVDNAVLLEGGNIVVPHGAVDEEGAKTNPPWLR